MKAILLALLPALLHGVVLPASHPFSVRASGAADDVIAALEVEKVPAAEREMWARIMYVFSFYESAFRADVVGDAGASCSVLQTQNPERWIDGATCSVLMTDRVLAYRVGYRIMRFAVAKCGSMRAGLGLFASGKCDGAPGLVLRRCKNAGIPC